MTHDVDVNKSDNTDENCTPVPPTEVSNQEQNNFSTSVLTKNVSTKAKNQTNGARHSMPVEPPNLVKCK